MFETGSSVSKMASVLRWLCAGRRGLCLGVVGLMLVGPFLYSQLLSACDNRPHMYMKEGSRVIHDSENKAYPYSRDMPLIFIGGVPRSGTTLMRAMLDAHAQVRCGEETRVIPRILGMRGQWAKSPKETDRLKEAGLTDDVIDDAISAFILEVIAKHGEAARRLCNKDPFTLKSSIYLAHLFPSSKFLLMVRDGRAVVHSIISRRVTISGFNLNSYPECLKKWNAAMESMYYQCIKVGPSRCLPVYYEQLVLHPDLWMRHILGFLGLPWDDAVLHHETFVNQPGGISLSKTERSTDQVIRPVNDAALTAWVPFMPAEVRTQAGALAPMLERLGYDPRAFPPNYGTADAQVLRNSADLRANAKNWTVRAQQLLSAPRNAHAYRREAELDEQDDADNVASNFVAGRVAGGELGGELYSNPVALRSGSAQKRANLAEHYADDFAEIERGARRPAIIRDRRTNNGRYLDGGGGPSFGESIDLSQQQLSDIRKQRQGKLFPVDPDEGPAREQYRYAYNNKEEEEENYGLQGS